MNYCKIININVGLVFADFINTPRSNKKFETYFQFMRVNPCKCLLKNMFKKKSRAAIPSKLN